MKRLAGRVGVALALLWVVATGTFFLLHALPGDAAAVYEDPRATPAARAHLREVYGLDRPLAEQYAKWLRAMASGEWGYSLARHRSVASALGDALPATLWLALAALLLEFGVGLPLGLAAATHAGGRFDRALRVVSLTLHALPSFWLGIVALLGLAFALPVFPPGGLRSIDAASLPAPGRALDLLAHLALPALVLGLPAAAATARLVRVGVLEVLGSEFVVAARARGLSNWRVAVRHALPAGLAPVLQAFGLSFAGLLSGALAVEIVFAWPGIGRLAYESLLARDYPLLLADTAITSMLVVAGSLLADMAHEALDPRVRSAA
ncbi:MAG: ABC transporter permease [Thermoanaerobaculia bacterium]